MIAHDLMTLTTAGVTYGVILVDPTWPFVTWSPRGKGRSADRHYDMMALDAIKALPIAKLAARDCALFLWATWPTMPIWNEVLTAWGFKYSGIGFLWVKVTPKATFIDLEALRQGRTGHGLHWGMGYGTRANTEPCLFARKGRPRRLGKNVHSVVIAPDGVMSPDVVVAAVREHSRKPNEVHERIERLFPGPYLELFARRAVPGWTVWGNEVDGYDRNADVEGSFNEAYRIIRERVAAGGPKWVPK
jgi:N6-adenosine-specific RNA methylase IME4